MKQILLQCINEPKIAPFIVFINYTIEKQIPMGIIKHKKGDTIIHTDILYYLSYGFTIQIQP